MNSLYVLPVVEIELLNGMEEWGEASAGNFPSRWFEVICWKT